MVEFYKLFQKLQKPNNLKFTKESRKSKVPHEPTPKRKKQYIFRFKTHFGLSNPDPEKLMIQILIYLDLLDCRKIADANNGILFFK